MVFDCVEEKGLAIFFAFNKIKGRGGKREVIARKQRNSLSSNV